MARDLLLRGMLAGLLAGLLALGLAALIGEPRSALTIGLGPAIEHATGRDVAPLVGYIATGVALGGVLALGFALAYQRVGRISASALSLLLTCAGFVIVALVPQLKYPPNPPSIGSGETIGLHTALYLEMVLISFGALVLALLLGRLLIASLGAQATLLLATAMFVVAVAALQLALPNLNEVPAGFPPAALWRFRLASFGTQFVLWVGLGAIFGAIVQRSLRV